MYLELKYFQVLITEIYYELKSNLIALIPSMKIRKLLRNVSSIDELKSRVSSIVYALELPSNAIVEMINSK